MNMEGCVWETLREERGRDVFMEGSEDLIEETVGNGVQLKRENGEARKPSQLSTILAEGPPRNDPSV